MAVILRSYVKYVLKGKDKDFDELQKELIVLANAGVIDVEFYNEVANDMNKFINKTNATKEPEMQ